MNRKWSYFVGAATLAAYLLLSHGAPLSAVAAGIGGAAIFLRRKPRTIQPAPPPGTADGQLAA